MTATDGLIVTDRIGPTPPTAPHLLDAAARYVCRHAPDADKATVLAALGIGDHR